MNALVLKGIPWVIPNTNSWPFAHPVFGLLFPHKKRQWGPYMVAPFVISFPLRAKEDILAFDSDYLTVVKNIISQLDYF